MLFNEPKLLKSVGDLIQRLRKGSFSALQRAEIAEIWSRMPARLTLTHGFSALQRAEIAEIRRRCSRRPRCAAGFSALQRAEIAEIVVTALMNEQRTRFSALQRAEIAEMMTTY